MRVKKWSLKFMITLFGQVRPFDEAFSKILGRHVVHILIIDIFHMLVACERIDLALLGWMELDPRTVIIHSIDQPTIRQPLLPQIFHHFPIFEAIWPHKSTISQHFPTIGGGALGSPSFSTTSEEPHRDLRGARGGDALRGRCGCGGGGWWRWWWWGLGDLGLGYAHK